MVKLHKYLMLKMFFREQREENRKEKKGEEKNKR